MAFQNHQLVDEIKSRIDIFDLVSERLTLKKVGQNWIGLCPFHSEKTPSFTVNPSKQIFHCFGCNKGGDVITFLMDYEKLTFQETLMELARRTGVEYKLSGFDSRDFQKKSVILDILKESAAFYATQLKSNIKVIEYLLRRGITEDSQIRFSIGYAPTDSNSLYSFLRRKGFKDEIIRDAGVVSREKRRDLLFKRIVFPIFNVSGDVIAFGGRVLDNQMPKYLNSPETAIFNKRRVLYGLSQAMKHGTSTRNEDFIVVEGYFDVIASHQHGFTNTVAPLGTALTEEQSRLLKRFTDQVIMVFDGDEAGLRAARRGFATLLKSGLEAKALMLEKGEDPDSFLRKGGAKIYSSNLLKRALTFTEFFATQQGDKQSFLKEAVEIVASMNDKIRQGYLLKSLARSFDIDERFLVDSIVKKNQHLIKVQIESTAKSQKRPKEEEHILGIVIQNPELVKQVLGPLSLDDFQNKTVREILKAIVSINEKQSDKFLQQLLQSVKDEEEKNLITKLALNDNFKKEPLKLLRGWILTILEKKVEKEYQMIQNQLKEMKSYIDDEIRNSMLKKANELALQRSQLFNERKSLR